MNRDNVTPFRKRRPPPKPVRQGPPLSTHRGKAVAVEACALLMGVFQALLVAPHVMVWIPGLDQAGLALAQNTPPPFVSSLLSLAAAGCGFFIALSNREQAMPWAQTHHEFALRTIVVGVCGSALASVTGFLGVLSIVAVPIRTLAALWVMARSGVGLMRAVGRQAMMNPTGWWF
jgi:uncharacterized membrane protein